MPTIYETKFDGSNAVGYFHFPIISFYLNSAHKYASSAVSQEEWGPASLQDVVIAVSFSSMTIEAFVNELAEDVISGEERESFDKTRHPYRKPRGESAVLYKYRELVRKRYMQEIPEELAREISDLVAVRNTLVHYKPQETAGRVIYPPNRRTDGWVSIDFMAKPIRVEPSFVQRLSHAEAAHAYNAALHTLTHWHKLKGDMRGLDKFPEIASNNSLKLDGLHGPST